MKITIDDVLEEPKKSIYDAIAEARNEATKRGIKANSIVINRGLVFVPGDPCFYPDMICGLKSYITAKELPEDYAFAVLHDPNREQEPQMKWIPVADRLPESQKTVLISVKDKTFGHRHTLMAAHIGHHEAKTEDYGWQEYDGDTEYDEEEDCFWIPECWWESNFVEDNTNWIIDSDYEVTHWMPLPKPPKGE